MISGSAVAHLRIPLRQTHRSSHTRRNDFLSEYDPDDSHELVRERDDRFVLASSRHEIPDPSALRMRVFIRPAHDSTSAVDEQDSQRPITIFGDAAELNATARAVLPWH